MQILCDSLVVSLWIDRFLSAGLSYQIRARNKRVSLHVVASETEISYLKVLLVATIM
jgi:hypothetical protein